LFARIRESAVPRFAVLVPLLFVFAGAPAHAVVKGSPSAHAGFTVRLVGNFHCSGVVLSRTAVATAGHCGRGLQVIAGGRSFGIAGVSRSTILDDGRRVSVSGDAAILQLASPLPADVPVAPIGDGRGDTYTIAGYGTTDERWRGSFGVLHDATLIAEAPYTLVDPNRTGSIGASACHGDSGGPVLRGGMLVGIITRAAHPSPHLACGHLTRWAPLTAYDPALAGDPVAAEAAMLKEEIQARAEKSARLKKTNSGTPGSLNLLGAFLPVQRAGSGLTHNASAAR
jgi:hypothetical protein